MKVKVNFGGLCAVYVWKTYLLYVWTIFLVAVLVTVIAKLFSFSFVMIIIKLKTFPFTWTRTRRVPVRCSWGPPWLHTLTLNLTITPIHNLYRLYILNAVRCPYVRMYVRDARRGQLNSK